MGESKGRKCEWGIYLKGERVTSRTMRVTERLFYVIGGGEAHPCYGRDGHISTGCIEDWNATLLSEGVMR